MTRYAKILTDLLEAHALSSNKDNMGIEAKVLIDHKRGHYQLLNNGWRNDDYFFYVVFHFDLIGGKIWIQENRTDMLMSEELQLLGVPKHDIVIGLLAPEDRTYNGYALA